MDNDKVFAVVIWLFINLVVLMFRAGQWQKPVDCEFRYVDIVFPLSRIACPVDWKTK